MKKFSRWRTWQDRDKIAKPNCPGVYCIAISDKSLSGSPHRWIEEIRYIGMSNSIKGVRGRLYQFDRTIKGHRGHGGAARFVYDYPNYEKLVKNLFVAVNLWDFDPKVLSHSSLRGKGDVAQHEYHCMASYLSKHKDLPIYNDQIEAPKLKRDGTVVDRRRIAS